MRIGLLGGSFNPVHNGHIILATEAKASLSLDKVIFIPAYIPPHKPAHELIEPGHRLAMLELAIKARPYFEISDFELNRDQKTYSIDTLRYFKKAYPEDTEFFFIIGADAFETLNTWKDLDELFKLCSFVVFNRPGCSNISGSNNIQKLDMPPVDISSTQIRQKIKQHQDIKGLVTEGVNDYIVSNNLYK
jgi:nicotinate-nucleotide adenylyltransferase